jgi:hypothetical protein
MFRGHRGSMQQQDYSSSKKALVISSIFDLDDHITIQIFTKAHLP